MQKQHVSTVFCVHESSPTKQYEVYRFANTSICGQCIYLLGEDVDVHSNLQKWCAFSNVHHADTGQWCRHCKRDETKAFGDAEFSTSKKSVGFLKSQECTG